MFEVFRLLNVVVSGSVFVLYSDFINGMCLIKCFELGECMVNICIGSDVIWVIVCCSGKGGLVLCLVYCSGGVWLVWKCLCCVGEKLWLVVVSVIGEYNIILCVNVFDLDLICVMISLIFIVLLFIFFYLCDFYLFSFNDDLMVMIG